MHDATAALTLKTSPRIAAERAARDTFDRHSQQEIQKAFDKHMFLASLEKHQRDAPCVTCAPRARKNTPRGL
jgi:hypothetical protein